MKINHSFQQVKVCIRQVLELTNKEKKGKKKKETPLLILIQIIVEK